MTRRWWGRIISTSAAAVLPVVLVGCDRQPGDDALPPRVAHSPSGEATVSQNALGGTQGTMFGGTGLEYDTTELAKAPQLGLSPVPIGVPDPGSATFDLSDVRNDVALLSDNRIVTYAVSVRSSHVALPAMASCVGNEL
jgi:hypothetical protein